MTALVAISAAREHGPGDSTDAARCMIDGPWAGRLWERPPDRNVRVVLDYDKVREAGGAHLILRPRGTRGRY